MKTRKLHQFDILVNWFAEYQTLNNYRPRTIKSYNHELSLFRRWLETKTTVEDIDSIEKENLIDFIASLYERQLTVRTIGNKAAILRSFFSRLYKENKLYRDLSPAIIMPRIGRQLPTNILSVEEIEKFFQVLEEQTNFIEARTRKQAVALRDRAIMEVLYSSGLRHGELKQLAPESINYSDKTIYIKEGKGGKDRVVPIGETALSAVTRYVQEARRFFLTESGQCFLFLSRKGGMLGKSVTGRIITNTLKAAKIEKHIRVHDMRHTCATHMLNNGADIRYVQELLGHANLSATQVYTHVAIDDLKQKHEQFHPRERWWE